jgi:hypothetical protein
MYYALSELNGNRLKALKGRNIIAMGAAHRKKERKNI